MKDKLKGKDVFSSVLSFNKEETYSKLAEDLVLKGVFIPFFILPDYEGKDYTEQ